MSQLRKKLLFLLCALLTLALPPLRRTLWAAVLSLLLARALRRSVAQLTRRGVPRRWAAALVGTALVSAGALVLWGILWAAWTALDRAACLLPDPEELFHRLRALTSSLPDGLGALSEQTLTALELRSAQLREALLLRAARLSARLLAQVPHALFFLVIVTLSACCAAADWVRLTALLRRALPEDWHGGWDRCLALLHRGLRRWMAVQGRLMLLQFLLLTAGLALLGQRAAGGVAALAAAADALPLLGTGAVLLPLAALRALEGASLPALGLLGLTLCCWSLRTVLEPRLVGRQTGQSPYFPLLGVYLGAECFGAGGIVLALLLFSALGALEQGD